MEQNKIVSAGFQHYNCFFSEFAWFEVGNLANYFTCFPRSMTSSQEKLWAVAQHGKVEDLRRLVIDWGDLSKDVTLHTKSGDHVTHVMARCNQLLMLHYLRDQLGVPLECTNLEGKVPLHEAATGGHPEIVSYLLSQGVSVDPLKRAGWTPLMLACAKSSLDVVVLLVEAGAKLDLRNKVSLLRRR